MIAVDKSGQVTATRVSTVQHGRRSNVYPVWLTLHRGGGVIGAARGVHL